MKHYQVSELGQIKVDADGLFELWYHGASLDGVDVGIDPEIEAYNAECARHGKTDFLIAADTKPALSHEQRIASWIIPDAYKELDVEEFCLSLCRGEEACNRVKEEMKMFRERNLFPMLQSLMFLVDTLRLNGVLWGVGRGSSVASYVLFLIGVHRIDSLKYNLRIEEFLR